MSSTQPKRWIIAFVMLVVISTPSFLFMLWKFQQVIVRYEMMEKLDRSKLQTIKIPASQVHWHEENREIVVDGILFDVKSFEKITGTDSMLFIGLFDLEETELEEKSGKLIQEKNEPDKTILIQNMWLFFCPWDESLQWHLVYVSDLTVLAYYTSGNMPMADLSTPAPPPKVNFPPYLLT